MFKMNPNLKILSIIAVILSSNSFSAVSVNQSCSFPHHITITGPQNTHIMVVKVADLPNALSVTNIIDNTFDVQLNDGENCKFGGAIYLQVGTDDEHYHDMVMVDTDHYPIQAISAGSTNGFEINKINDSNKKEIEINYRQD